MTARFADSLFFFALGNPVDPAHKQAKEFAEGFKFVTFGEIEKT